MARTINIKGVECPVVNAMEPALGYVIAIAPNGESFIAGKHFYRHVGFVSNVRNPFEVVRSVEKALAAELASNA
jgi:hypothetical protein